MKVIYLLFVILLFTPLGITAQNIQGLTVADKLVPNSIIIQRAWTEMIGKSIKNRDGVQVEITREDLENAILVNQVDFSPDSLGNIICQIRDNHFFYYILDKKVSYLIYWSNDPEVYNAKELLASNLADYSTKLKTYIRPYISPYFDYGTELETYNLAEMIDVLEYTPSDYAYFLTYFFPGNLSVTPVLSSLSYNKDKGRDFLFIRKPRLMAFDSIDEYIGFCFASWKNYIEIYPKRIEYEKNHSGLRDIDLSKKRIWDR